MKIGIPAAALAAALLLAVSWTTARADDILGKDAALRRDIHDHLERGDDAGAAPLLDQYIARRPDDGDLLWEAVRVNCRLGEIERADSLVLEAVKAGFLDFSRMLRDPDVRALRTMPRFRIVMDARAAADPLLIDRQVKSWLDRAPEGTYERIDDPARKLHVLAGPSVDAAALHARAVAVVDRLGEMFGDLRLGVLLIVPRPEDLPAAFSDRHVRGRYRRGQRELIALDARRSLTHELVHAFHHDHMDALGQAHPLWVQEALATLFESMDLESGGPPVFRPNERDGIARRLAEQGRLTPWSELLTDEPGTQPGAVYAQLRAVVHYLADVGLLEAWYATYTRTHRIDPTGRVALERVLLAPLDSIESRWAKWLLERPVPIEVVRSAPPLVRPRASTVVAGTPEEALDLDADTVASLHRAARDAYGRGAYANAISEFERLLQLDPEHASARYEMALAAVRHGDVALAEAQHAQLKALDASLASLLANLLR